MALSSNPCHPTRPTFHCVIAIYYSSSWNLTKIGFQEPPPSPLANHAIISLPNPLNEPQSTKNDVCSTREGGNFLTPMANLQGASLQQTRAHEYCVRTALRQAREWTTQQTQERVDERLKDDWEVERGEILCRGVLSNRSLMEVVREVGVSLVWEGGGGIACSLARGGILHCSSRRGGWSIAMEQYCTLSTDIATQY
jgi:hypothetical protein